MTRPTSASRISARTYPIAIGVLKDGLKPPLVTIPAATPFLVTISAPVLGTPAP